MTRADIRELVYRLHKELRSLNIPVGELRKVQIVDVKGYCGECIEYSDNSYVIKISYINLMAGRKSLYNTILHELTHTIKGCYNHGKKFHRYGALIGAIYNTDITANSTDDEVNAMKQYKPYMKTILERI